MKRLISFGKGFQFVGTDAPDPVVRRDDEPRHPQRVRTVKPERMANFRELSTRGNGYRPGPFQDLGDDQCRFTVHGTTMCGAKTVHGAWCGEHLTRVRA